MRNNNWKRVLFLALALLMLAGCAQRAPAPVPDAPETPETPEAPAVPDEPEEPKAPDAPAAPSFPAPENAQLAPLPEDAEGMTDVVPVDEDLVEIAAEVVALSASPAAVPNFDAVSAPGTAEKRNSKAVIDYSNMADGYVMVQYTGKTDKRLKALVKGPTTQYQYNLTAGEWDALPLSDGNGQYAVAVYENVEGTKYATVVSVTLDVKLTDEFGPYLHSNQYVDFEGAENTLAKAAELCAGIDDPLKKVEAVYGFVVKTLSYDKEKAKNVKSGYLPVLDDVLEKKKGICFDYAALMTGMLRSQGVPCKLVVGYAGTAYHAWISVWSDKDGWIEGAVYFDGTSWQRMDPTFASSGNQSADIMKYIGDGNNYSSKYFY